MRSWVWLAGVISLLGSVSPSTKNVRVVIAEMPNTANGGGHTTASQQRTPQQTVEILKQNGFRIIQEREVVYAIPPTYFEPLSQASDLLSRVELFREYVPDAIPEEALSRIQSVARVYNFSLEGVSKVIFSAAVIAVVEDNQSVYQLDVLPAMADQSSFAAFFTGDLERWRAIVHAKADTTVKEELLKDLIPDLPDNFRIGRADIPRVPKSSVSPHHQKISVFFSSYSAIRVSEEQKARFLARYYQLVQRESEKERARWNKAWLFALHQLLGDSLRLDGWNGNTWEGSWNALPEELRQKLALLLQARGMMNASSKSVWRIVIVPYVGLVREGEAGTYSDWFPITR